MCVAAGCSIFKIALTHALAICVTIHTYMQRSPWRVIQNRSFFIQNCSDTTSSVTRAMARWPTEGN